MTFTLTNPAISPSLIQLGARAQDIVLNFEDMHLSAVEVTVTTDTGSFKISLANQKDDENHEALDLGYWFGDNDVSRLFYLNDESLDPEDAEAMGLDEDEAAELAEALKVAYDTVMRAYTRYLTEASKGFVAAL